MESKIEKFVGDDSCTPRDFDTYRYINNLQDKVNEIIDHLNSQAQPEEKEEWKKRYVKRFGYWSEEIKFIQQLLDEREREVLERLLEKRSRLPFTENWLVWVTHITRELNKLDGKKQ